MFDFLILNVEILFLNLPRCFRPAKRAPHSTITNPPVSRGYACGRLSTDVSCVEYFTTYLLNNWVFILNAYFITIEIQSLSNLIADAKINWSVKYFFLI